MGQVENLTEKTEFNRFGLISVVILIIGTMGGLAVGLGAVESVLMLTFIVVPTMATLSLLLAVAPMKYILTGAIISVVIDVLMIAYLLIV